MTDSLAREQFLACLYGGPLLTADAIVLLAGEDSQPRADVAFGLFTRGAAPGILVTGRATTDGPHTSADDAATMLMAHGCAPDRITVDRQAEHTRGQALRLITAARAGDWRRILLVASAYHLPRAFLTVVKALDEAALTLHVVPVAASQAPWFGCPAGMTETRLERLATDLAKCATYGDHVASWSEGLDHLRHWEGK